MVDNMLKSKGCVIPEEIFDGISSSVGADWKRFGRLMHLEESQIECIDLENTTVYEKCRRDLTERVRKDPELSWTDMKITLGKINRNDIVKKCEKITSLAHNPATSEGKLADASRRLRNRYLQQYTHLFSDNSTTPTQTLDRISAFVDLAISSSGDVHDYWNHNSDRDYHLNQHLFKGQNITIKDIMTEADNLVTLGGVAGSGKSTLLLYLLLKWANQEIWTNVYQQYDFVFSIVCREINCIERCDSLESLLKELYPEVFQVITFDHLLSISDRVLIVIDGIDEFVGLNDMISQNDGLLQVSNISKCLFQAVNPVHASLFGHKVLISGRPEAISKVQKRFQKFVNVKSIEVLGFNNENVELFVKNYFVNDGNKYDIVLQKIKESTNLGLMASLPVYLSIICSLFQSDTNISADTSVELFCWALGLFLKNHFRGKAVSAMVLRDLFKQENVKKMLAIVTEMAYEMLCDGTVVFDADLLPGQFEESLEYCGLVTRVNVDEFSVKYQFRHLSLQEFCAAAHILRRDIPRADVLKNNRLHGCVPVLCGLEAALVPGYNTKNIVKAFVRALEIQRLKQNPTIKYLAQNLFNDTNRLCVLTGSNDAWNLFAASFYEYRKPLDDAVMSVIAKSRIILYLKNISRIQVTFMIYFLDQVVLLKTFPVKDIYLQVWNNDVNDKECQKLAKYMCLTNGVHIERMDVLMPEDLELINTEFQCLLQRNVVPAIKELRFYACKLTSDHLLALESVLLHLHTLVLSYNKRISIVGWKLIAKLFEKGCLLKKLHIRDCSIEDGDLITLAPTIPYLYEIELSDNPYISISGWSEFVKSMANSNSLKKLYIRGCNLRDDVVEILLPAFLNLHELDISFNKAITAVGWKKLCSFLEQEKASSILLNHLNVKHCNLHSYFLEKLKSVVTLVECSDISTSKLDNPNHLQTNDSSQLNKINCSLDDKGLAVLCNDLSHVKRIDLSSNGNITTDGWNNLAGAINQGKCNLTELVLCDCNLIDDDVMSLSSVLPGLKKLRLSKNGSITTDGWKLLGSIECDDFGRHLKGLNLRSCRLNDESMIVLKPIMKYLNYFSLSNNPRITTLGWKCLREAIFDSKEVSLKVLSVRDCDLNDASLKELLPVTPYLYSLKLGGNLKITPVGWKGVGTSICSKTFCLRELDVIRTLLTDEDLIVLMPLIPFLHKFDVRFNRCITTIGWKLLASEARNHSSCALKFINLKGCFISNADLKSLSEIIPIVNV